MFTYITDDVFRFDVKEVRYNVLIVPVERAVTAFSPQPASLRVVAVVDDANLIHVDTANCPSVPLAI